MQKIVVIDDEARQCKSMKKIVEKLFPGILAEAFTNPASAIEYIENESINIIITDICMPGLDGLELLQMLMNTDKSRKVILLTGYAEFEYARKAVSAGAYDFLLKPMDPDKLKAVIEKCLYEVRKEALSRQEYSQMHERLSAAWPVYMENLMNQWLTGSLTSEEQEKIHQIFPENKRGFIILTRFSGFGRKKEILGSQELMELKNRLGLRMREHIGQSYHSLSFFCNIPETMATLVFSKSMECGYPVRIKNMGLWNIFSTELGTEDGIYIQMGAGMYMKNLEEEKKTAYESAREALEYAFYFPGTNICFRSDIEHEINTQARLNITQEKLLADALAEGFEENIPACMDKILEDCLSQGYPHPGDFIREVEGFLKHVAMSLAYKAEFLCSDGGYRTYSRFREEIHIYLMGFLKEMKLRYAGKKSGFTREFQHYMKMHYMENISLEDVADNFMLTPSYCSRLVKESMGSTFTQILIEERIKEAKELLKNTDMHIYEIASRVGYSDVKYFNRVFKSCTGMTPQQFRRESVGGGR